MIALRPPIGYFGSKVRVASRIVDLMPEHDGYVEPFCGSLAVLLAKPAGPMEVVNDLDQDLMTFWCVLRDRPRDLARLCRLTPHSRAEYSNAWPIPAGTPDLERARRVWVKLTQGRSATFRSTGWRYHEAPGNRTSTMPRTLDGYVERIELVAERLSAVTLECKPAIEIIERYGRDRHALLYVDPPYLGEVRCYGNIYRHELRHVDEHRELADALHAAKATVVLSGYESPLYADLYGDWDHARIATGTGQNAAVGWQERTEVVWCNRALRKDLPLWDEATA